MATKISMVGKPEVGKTTIKKVMFDGEDPNELIIFPLEPTIGIKYTVHDFMDLKISIIDSPGQSLPTLLEDDQKQILTFGDTSVIIYVFDYPNWIKNSQDILDDVKKLYEIRKKHGFEAKLILFLHKIDLLITKKIGSMLALIRRQISKQLSFPEELPIYFTSLHPNLIYTIYNAISDTISNFSKETSNLKEIVKEAISGLSKTSCFVSNQDDNLIIQEMTHDFDTSILFYLYEKLYHLSKANNFSTTKTSVISPGAKILNMVIEDINQYHTNFKYIILLSETIGQNSMIKILDELKKKLNQFYQ
ncbi:MAG: hypothetical protein ACFFE5_12170 [Candidatus Thorarchaeota archaeon]